MKKFGIFMCSLALVGMTFTSCDPEDGPQGGVDFDNLVEDGFYAVGEACPIKTVDAENAVLAQMSQGVNEVLMDQDKLSWEESKRDGMWEKYIYLEGGKDFELILKEGENQTIYGANLAKTMINTDKGEQEHYKGSLVIGQKMQVAESGLYHIVLDLNKDGKLDLTGKEQIIVVPVEWAVTVSNNDVKASKVEEISATEIVWSWDTVTIKPTDWFKFKDYVTGWKIQLDDAGTVKAHTNMGTDSIGNLINGTGNLPAVDKYGKYAITLTYKLAKGQVGNSYSYTIKLVEELQPTYPETMFMIGEEFGNWDWNSESIVEMVPVNSDPNVGKEGAFWCTRKITAGKGFKFCSVREWNGDFATLGESDVTVDGGGNLVVKEDGLYTVVVDLAENKVSVKKAEVYGMGDVFGGWNAGTYPFTINADGTATITAVNAGEVRMYTAVEGADWWCTEYIVLDGKIVYRGNGSDQQRVNVTAGQKVTLDFNAGTGVIE